MKTKVIFRLSCITVLIIGCMICACLVARISAACQEQNYIAHGGGAIDGHITTNSLESVELSIEKGVKYIELDLQLTSDGKLVAAHDWQSFNQSTGRTGTKTSVPSYEEFTRCRIHGKYTPMTYKMIDSVFSAHPELTLVTDKIEDVKVIDRFLKQLKSRIIIECFTPRQYEDCVKLGYMPMRSYHNFKSGGLNVIKYRCARYIYQQILPTQYAVFDSRRLSVRDADSIFSSDSRIRFVYVDYL